MADYNEIVNKLRHDLEIAKTKLIEKKEKKRRIGDKKDVVDADYEYISRSVLESQENVTRISRMINDLLNKTGI